jgi:hypothetical protein
MTIKTPAQSASDVIDIITGRTIRLNSQIKKIPEAKPDNHLKTKFVTPLVLLIILLLSPVFVTKSLLARKFQIKGSVNVRKRAAADQEINFFYEKENIQKIQTDSLGNFHLKLSEGTYKIYFSENVSKKYSEPETTPLSIKVNRDLENIKIYIPF